MPADLLAALDGCRSLDQILSLDEGGTGTVLPADIQENPLEPSFAFLRLIIREEVQLHISLLKLVGSYAEAAN